MISTPSATTVPGGRGIGANAPEPSVMAVDDVPSGSRNLVVSPPTAPMSLPSRTATENRAEAAATGWLDARFQVRLAAVSGTRVSTPVTVTATAGNSP